MRTPFCILILRISRTLHDVVAQNACNFQSMVNLHRCVYAISTVLLKVLARFLTGSKEDSSII
jgi:hypothetical protein